MKEYLSRKVVNAGPMGSTAWKQYRTKLRSGAYSDASLEDGLEGYVVVYERGTDKEYWSWSPKEQFESGYVTSEEDSKMGRMPHYG